jgi:hypothetical protein
MPLIEIDPSKQHESADQNLITVTSPRAAFNSLAAAAAAIRSPFIIE